jgi:ribosomal protein S18 acetylase RimI-like enzyme
MPPTPGSSRISGSSEAAAAPFDIRPARGAADIDTYRALCAEYGETIKDVALLCGFKEELAGLPGVYAPPKGEILIARDEAGTAQGCVTLHPLPDGTAEIKRLYVRAGTRRGGLGRALMLAIIDVARRIGYDEVRLDSLPSMTQAQALYRSMGFVEIGRYNSNPNPVLVFMSLKL